MVQSAAVSGDRPHSLDGMSLRATRYERVSAALTSALLLVGTLTLLMLLAWLLRTAHWSRPAARVSLGGGGKSEKPNALPKETIPDFQPPGPEELAEASEPPPELTLESLAPIVESQRVTMDA